MVISDADLIARLIIKTNVAIVLHVKTPKFAVFFLTIHPI